MNVLYILIPLALVLLAGAVWAFFWAVSSGQFDDLDTPAMRFHGQLAECQPQTAPLFFCSIKWIKYLLNVFKLNTMTGILESNLNIFPW